MIHNENAGNNGLQSGRSLGLWSQFLTAQPYPSSDMELHFNYWRVTSPDKPLSSTSTSRINRLRRCALNLFRSAYTKGLTWGLGDEHDDDKLTHDFLDIGIMITFSEGLSSISLYIPVPLQQDAVEDLGRVFQTASLATGIFNERLLPTEQSSSRLVLKRQEDESTFCYVHLFATLAGSRQPERNELKVEQASGGSLLTITPEAMSHALDRLSPGDKVYFRLRLNLSATGTNRLVKTVEPRDRRLLSGFETIDYIDFRLNEARNLPDTIEREMMREARKGTIPIMRIDFLLVVPIEADLVGGHKEFHKSRLLESELWGDYVGNGKPERRIREGMVIYHWRDRIKDRKAAPELEQSARAEDGKSDTPQGIKDFNAFAKLRIRRSSKEILGDYLLIVLAIGAIGSLGATAMMSVFDWLCDVLYAIFDALRPLAAWANGQIRN